MAAATPRSARARRSLRLPSPPDAKTGKLRRLGDILHERQVGSAHRFLPMDGGYKHTRERQPVELFNEVEHELGVGARPAVRQDLPIADIRGDDDATREKAAHLREPVEVFQRARANDYALRSIIERALNQFPASYSPSQLYLDVGRSENGLNFRRVVPPSRHCIQVDQVKVPESVLPPGNGDSDRIGNPDKLLVVGTSRELNAGAASEVERGNCDHPARRQHQGTNHERRKCRIDCMLASL